MKFREQIAVRKLLLFPVLMAFSGFLSLACAIPQARDPNGIVDRIVVVKSTRTMTLESNGHTVRSYKVALGGAAIGPKEQEGDHKTPEGEYFVDAKNSHSHFYLALHLSYPNATDRGRAHMLGANPGGDVEIHGLGKWFGWIGPRHRLMDWTDGCVAVTNEEIEEIFKLVPVGTRVELKP